MPADLTFGGYPDRLRLSDWLLVEWVAGAKRGSPFPEPWCHAHSPLESMVRQLVELGVMDPPAPGTDVATVARDATAAAQAWLQSHPRPQPEPLTTTRRQQRGRPYGI
ncbi:MAG TPA: hypothetical protein VGV90_14425 [Solirubrobacteraceae bacterium]|nr:hypothetical protein [Solirubrobacteraceae bacterium]